MERLRAVAYPRVSSQQQRDNDTVASQLAVLPQRVRARGWELVRAADYYLDDGRSAKTGRLGKREGFQRLLADATAGVFDIVIIVGFDRLTRTEDIGELGKILGPLQRAGVRIADGEGEVIDLGTRTGRWMAMIKAMVAADENAARRERTVRARLHGLAAGHKPPGPSPYGLRYDRATHVWSIDEAEGAIVREIFDRVAMGESCETIAQDLDRRRVRRARSSSWQRERVWSLARATTYRGEWLADRASGVRLSVPAIVSDELWFAAQEALSSYGVRRGRRHARHVYLLEGIAVCGLCGGRIGVSSGDPRRWRQTYYICGRRRRVRYGEQRCLLPMRQVRHVDEELWEAVVDLLATPGRLEDALAVRAAESGDGARWQADLSTAEQSLSRLEAAEAVILSRFRDGLVSEAAMDRELREAARKRDMLRRQVEAARQAIAAGQRVDAAEEGARARAATLRTLTTVATLRERLADADEATRRDLVQLLIPGIGRHVVTMGADAIEARGYLQQATPIAPTLAAGSSSVTTTRGAVTLELLVG